jgi:[acyl-carrier-protein] S-malonyltransferase
MRPTFGFLFPGQGAQVVGMGRDFAAKSPAAAALFRRADEVLELPLSKLCFEGPLEELTATDIAQPAIYTCSLAAMAALGEAADEPPVPAMTAGLSLGEYTAIAAAGAVSFEDGLKLVRLRGAAMQEASEAKPSGMAGVMGLDRAGLDEACAAVAAESGAILQVANLNSPGQIVVSGEDAALDLMEAKGKELGIRRMRRLTVAGAFHSEVMRPASETLAAALEETPFDDARCPVWQNATAKPAQAADELKRHLVAQLCAPVLWEESFRGMAAADPGLAFLEPAPGKVLASLARKIVPDCTVHNLQAAEDIDALLPLMR